MKNFHILVRDTDKVIIGNGPAGSADENSPWRPISGETAYNLSFSSDVNDGADVTTPSAKPENGSIYDGTTYTPPARGKYLALSWEGAGADVDGMRELSPDGVKTVTLRLQKKEKVTDNDQTDASDDDTYRICVETGNVLPSVGKVSLVNGTATVDFTPASGEKGIITVDLCPVDDAVRPSGKASLCLV